MKQAVPGWPSSKAGSLMLFDELDERKAPFEIKLTAMAFLLFSFPMCLLVVLDSKPSVQTLFGRWALYSVLVLVAWILVCHVFLVKGIVRRGMAAILVIVLPSAVLAGVCQVHAWQFQEKASALVSTDCSSFLQKSALNRAWEAANTFRTNCMVQDANITNLSPAQAQLVQDLMRSFNNLDLMLCPGFDEAQAQYNGAWEYLSYIENNYYCGGWCKAAAPIFVNGVAIQDTCSLAVGRALANDISLLGTQVTFYAVILFSTAAVLLLVSPNSLAATY